MDAWKLQWASDKASSLDLPALTVWQTRVLRRAVRFVGYPYVWGGMSEFAESPFGVDARGGFDCSGFVWRVYKLERWTGAPKLGSTLRGRTTYAMSGEMPKARRIRAAASGPPTSSSSGIAGHGHARRRSATWGFTWAAAGLCTLRARA